MSHLREQPPLPLSLTPDGFLPPGIHEVGFSEARRLFVFNARREELWGKATEFIDWARELSAFTRIYLDGGFVSDKPWPEDIDLILETRAPYGPAALEAMAPVFKLGLDHIESKYGVHVHFWSDGFPGGMHDFRMFFQYVRPQEAAPRGLPTGLLKGILRIEL